MLLSKNENIVLDTLKRLKMARNVTKISEEADLPRTTTTFILKKLEKRKMVEKIKLDGRYGGQRRFGWKLKRKVPPDFFSKEDRQQLIEAAMREM